jgi:hypothetical protein
MTCFSPLVVYSVPNENDPTKRRIVFNPPPTTSAYSINKPFNIDCGQCAGCRLAKAREWAVRCTHEAMMHERSSFLTLTFSEAGLVGRQNKYKDKDKQDIYSLNVRDFQLFMKRLRKYVKKHCNFTNKDISYYHCGEYGEINHRPHYHALLFGYDFPDKYIWYKAKDKNKHLYRSEILEKLWPHGNSLIGNVTYESASYVARYVMKKINGEQQNEHYKEVIPEYATMSRGKKNAIGYRWYSKYGLSDCHNNDRVSIRSDNGTFYIKPPRYYDKLLEQNNLTLYDKIKAKRREETPDPILRRFPHDRLSVKEKLQHIKLEKMIRNNI